MIQSRAIRFQADKLIQTKFKNNLNKMMLLITDNKFLA